MGRVLTLTTHPMASATAIKLLSKDGKEFEVSREVACRSETVKNMVEDCSPDEAVPLPNVESSVLSKVVEYCEYHHKAEASTTPQDSVDTWDKEFVSVDDEVLFNMILAANFLDVKPLLDLTCKKVAEYIKECKTPEEIRKRFNIKNDFTPEEEEEVRRENAWCEDRGGRGDFVRRGSRPLTRECGSLLEMISGPQISL